MSSSLDAPTNTSQTTSSIPLSSIVTFSSLPISPSSVPLSSILQLSQSASSALRSLVVTSITLQPSLSTASILLSSVLSASAQSSKPASISSSTFGASFPTKLILSSSIVPKASSVSPTPTIIPSITTRPNVPPIEPGTSSKFMPAAPVTSESQKTSSHSVASTQSRADILVTMSSHESTTPKFTPAGPVAKDPVSQEGSKSSLSHSATKATSATVKPSSQSPSSTPNNEKAQANPAPKTSASSSPHKATPAATSISVLRVTPTSTMTSTITDRPESTFKSVIAITSVNPMDGKTATITPDFLTVLSTSTEPDGSFVTYTHVVANPTSLSDASPLTGFLHNQGAMAGVFVVVGILAAVLVVGGAFFCRRRRSLNRRRRWLAGLRQQPPMTGNPFDDPPLIRTAQSDRARDEMVWNSRNRVTHNLNDDAGYAPHSAQGMAGDGTGTRGSTGSQDSAPFNDSGEYRPNLGLILSTDRSNNMSRPSFAQSSPSIYPPSLPPVGDDIYGLIDTRTPVRNTFVVPPPRPPRSHLRSTISKDVDYIPLTPPSSVSSHPSDKPPSPIEDIIKSLETFPDRYPQSKQHPQQDAVFTRRTLLDVRPRSRDNIDPS